jgi:hypothetical protein
MDELDPLSTLFVAHPDYDLQDERNEVDRLWQRQQAIDGLLSGTVPLDYCLDLLDEQGINPVQWVDASIENINLVMANDLIIVG